MKWHHERGTVLMEYIILNFLVIFVLVAAGFFFIEPDGGPVGNDTTQTDPSTGATMTSVQFGFLGDAFIKRYNLMLQVVSMPYP